MHRNTLDANYWNVVIGPDQSENNLVIPVTKALMVYITRSELLASAPFIVSVNTKTPKYRRPVVPRHSMHGGDNNVVQSR